MNELEQRENSSNNKWHLPFIYVHLLLPTWFNYFYRDIFKNRHQMKSLSSLNEFPCIDSHKPRLQYIIVYYFQWTFCLHNLIQQL